MNLYKKIKQQIFIIFKLSLIFTTVFLLCGYGYAGDLPQLGKTEKSLIKNEVPIQVKQASPVKDTDQPKFPETKTFFPRIYSGYKIDKYNEYLQDIKQLEPLLVSLKQVIKSNNPDKTQQFSAKVNILNLYVANLKDKYSTKEEKNYESFKQLVILDKYLTEAANYQKETDKYRKTIRGSLANKIQDEKYIHKKIAQSLSTLDAVLAIIQTAN